MEEHCHDEGRAEDPRRPSQSGPSQPCTDPRKRMPWWAPAIVLALLAIAMLLTVDIDAFRHWLETAGPWAPLLFVLVSIVLMSTVVPKTAISVTAGALFGTTAGALLLIVIAVLAAAINYAIGRWWFAAAKRDATRTSGPAASPGPRWRAALTDTSRDAGFGLHLLLRLSPIPTMIISYAMGAMGARLIPYLAAAAVAVVPQLLWIHGGASVAEIPNADAPALGWVTTSLSLLMAVVVTVVIPREAMKRLDPSPPDEAPITSDPHPLASDHPE